LPQRRWKSVHTLTVRSHPRTRRGRASRPSRGGSGTRGEVPGARHPRGRGGSGSRRRLRPHQGGRRLSAAAVARERARRGRSRAPAPDCVVARGDRPGGTGAGSAGSGHVPEGRGVVPRPAGDGRRRGWKARLAEAHACPLSFAGGPALRPLRREGSSQTRTVAVVLPGHEQGGLPANRSAGGGGRRARERSDCGLEQRVARVAELPRAPPRQRGFGPSRGRSRRRDAGRRRRRTASGDSRTSLTTACARGTAAGSRARRGRPLRPARGRLEQAGPAPTGGRCTSRAAVAERRRCDSTITSGCVACRGRGRADGLLRSDTQLASTAFPRSRCGRRGNAARGRWWRDDGGRSGNRRRPTVQRRGPQRTVAHRWAERCTDGGGGLGPMGGLRLEGVRGLGHRRIAPFFTANSESSSPGATASSARRNRGFEDADSGAPTNRAPGAHFGLRRTPTTAPVGWRDAHDCWVCRLHTADAVTG